MSVTPVSPEQRRALAGAADRPRTRAEALLLARLDDEAGMPGSAAMWRAVADGLPSAAAPVAPRVRRRAPAPDRDPLVVPGFVLAVLGAVLSVVPIIGVVAWVLAPLGLGLSLTVLSRTAYRARYRGLAVAGVACGAIGLVLCTLWLFTFAMTGTFHR